MREPTAGPSGTVYGQVQPQGSYGVPINPPNNGPPGVFYGVPGGGTPLPGPNPSGVPTKPASEQQMAAAHEGRSARGTKRNVQLINTVTNPYGSTVDTTHDSSSTGNSNDIYGVDNSGTNYANDSDESDSWMDSGYTTDSDAPENESDDGSTESLERESHSLNYSAAKIEFTIKRILSRVKMWGTEYKSPFSPWLQKIKTYILTSS
ncbi:hypothetical protein AB4K20DRAFT_1867894 [Rhizopus microsporus]